MPKAGMMQDEDQMGATPKEGMDDNESVSIFLTKAQLEGRTVKPGDTLTLKVRDVDPESGEVEAVCDYGEEQTNSKPGYGDEPPSVRGMPGEDE